MPGELCYCQFSGTGVQGEVCQITGKLDETSGIWQAYLCLKIS